MFYQWPHPRHVFTSPSVMTVTWWRHIIIWHVFWWTYDSCITFNYYSFSRISQHYRFSQQETFVSGKWLSRRLSSLTLLNKEFLSRPYNWTSVRQLIQNWTSNMFVHVQKFNYWIAIWISRIWNLDRKFRYHQFHKKWIFPWNPSKKWTFSNPKFSFSVFRTKFHGHFRLNFEPNSYMHSAKFCWKLTFFCENGSKLNFKEKYARCIFTQNLN